MTGASWLAAGCLAAAALALLPSGGGNARRRLAALTRGDESMGTGRAAYLTRWRPPLWTAVVAGAGTVTGVATVAGGPVAGMATTAYSAVAVRILVRRRADRAAARSHVQTLDALYCLAADLRAGTPATAVSIVDGGDRLARLAETLRRLADQTGAPLADLLERVAADARATDRIRAVAAAQAAGAQATAWLLAALPAGGIALGYSIGADPLRVLLHTPIGAGCAAGAIGLQVAGLVWADRLIRPAPLDPRTERAGARAARPVPRTPAGARATPIDTQLVR